MQAVDGEVTYEWADVSWDVNDSRPMFGVMRGFGPGKWSGKEGEEEFRKAEFSNGGDPYGPESDDHHHHHHHCKRWHKFKKVVCPILVGLGLLCCIKCCIIAHLHKKHQAQATEE